MSSPLASATACVASFSFALFLSETNKLYCTLELQELNCIFGRNTYMDLCSSRGCDVIGEQAAGSGSPCCVPHRGFMLYVRLACCS
jgi:hypothetical protein